ncbi:hypothetical protein [Qipengyuania huizhouensis]|uniref:hypothetical protein n=1 Tax=Qipengyuania huizhouensis TaxID=2867245 RepID=UPI001C88C854|nr:hypothetical protein [Qipengyuania huizhouensis]MBX7460375.1 hypothetical protein [Qipengyuania huizhouensis]
MELVFNVAVGPMSCGWSNVGSWYALVEISTPDKGGNVAIGDVNLLDCSNTFTNIEGARISAVGMTDMIIDSSSSGFWSGAANTCCPSRISAMIARRIICAIGHLRHLNQ